MFVDKWKPLLAPETEVGSDAPAEAPVPMNEAPVDGPGSGRSEIRKSLEKGFADARKETEREDRRDRDTGRFQKSRARQEQELQEQEQEAPEQQEQEGTPVEAGDEDTGFEIVAPEGWTKDAKAEWANLPPAVQAAVTKREVDMAKGVEELKKKYTEIDNALAPRLETIRRHGHTPAAAVNQLFAWFEALGANPQVAFPALANSFKFDLRTIPGLGPQQQQPAQVPEKPQKEVGAPEIPEYAKTLEQKIAELQNQFQYQLGQLSTNFQAQTQSRTEENLAVWSKDKPYFEEVRQFMGQLIGSGTIPPLPNGNADLDKAYETALWAMPEVRAKVQADMAQKQAEARRAKAAAEKAAQQEAADKARRATGSLAPGAPGAPAQDTKKGKKGKSVRESIMEARQELSDTV